MTIPIHAGMPVYEGDPPVEIALSFSIDRGDPANVSRLSMGAHTGTHVDAPRHFIDGASAVDEIPLDALIGPAQVVDLTGIGDISHEVLLSAGLEGKERVLFKTSNSSLWRESGFQRDFTYIAGSAAEHLVEIGVKLVGIDYLSVEKYGASVPVTHTTLLEAGIVILEGLDLSGIQPGGYELICLPMLIKGCDGAPCRAVLAKE